MLAAPFLALLACSGDAWQDTVDDVLAAERTFAARASDTTVQQAFLENIADDGVLFRPGPLPAHELLRAAPFPADFRLEWEPEWADASASGGLGYTTGPWSAGRRAANTEPASRGSYVTLWRRSDRNEWRAILDFGTGGATEGTTVSTRSPAAPPSSSEDADSAAFAHSIRLVDEDFVAVVADSSALASFVTNDTRFLRDGSLATIGESAAQDAYTHRERSARWNASGSGVSRAGDLGFVYGTWQAIAPDSVTGAWLRIWRRDGAGDWKLALDAVTGSRSASIP